MKKAIGLLALSASCIFANRASASQICGWINNPSPANLYIQDREGTWEIAAQGSRGANGADKVWKSRINYDEFVDTTASMKTGYGTWCGCLDANINKAGKRITTVHYAKQALLKTCLEDVNLPVFDFPRR